MKTKIQWNKVTWYSKIVAIIVFVATFFLGIYLGVKYDQTNHACTTQIGSEYPSVPSQPSAVTNLRDPRLNQAVEAVKNSQEITFDSPIDVNWKGDIVSFFQSGMNYNIKKSPEDANFPNFYAGIESEAFPEHVAMEGAVEVTGKWLGITCAYKNTVFKRCVPDVLVDEIRPQEPLKNIGEIDWTKPYAFYVASFSRDDFRDVYQETYTGGAHCCYQYKAFIQTGENTIFPVPIAEQNHPLVPKDVNNDGISELVGSDSTFDYWNASYADSPAPEIILSLDPVKRTFYLNRELMKKPAPSKADLEKKLADLRGDEQLNNKGNIEGFPSPFWGYMLDLIYSGNEPSAWQFFDLAWSSTNPQKDKFKEDFQKQLLKSPYYKELK